MFGKNNHLANKICYRFFVAIVSLFTIHAITFFVLEAIPGEVYDTDYIKNEAVLDNIRSKYHLDSPLWQRYLTSLKNTIFMDFGYSFLNGGRSVNDIIAQHFRVSALYGVIAIICSFITASILGSIVSRKQKRMSAASMVISITTGIPTFVIAALLQYCFCVRLGLFPVYSGEGFSGFILPLTIISLPVTMIMLRFAMNSMRETRNKDYVLQARSFRIQKSLIELLYLFKNSLTGVLTYLGTAVVDVVVGSFVVETIFNIPGLGRYFISSITNRDYPVIMGLTMFYSVLIIVSTTVFDIIIYYVDYSGRRDIKNEA